MITLKNKKVSLRACLLMCLICIVLTGVVSATPTMKQIVAYLNYGLNIVIDGETKELYNSNGDKIYPITFDGATYVPVRSISELLGVSVDWDGNTNSVLLNTKVEKVNIIQGIEKATDYSYVLGDGQKVVNVSETEVYNFNSGIYCKSLLNEDIKYSEYIGLSIPNGVKNISFVGYSDCSNSINVFNQQGKLIKTFYINPKTITNYNFDIDSSKNTQIYIVGLCQDENATEKYIKIFDIVGSK